LRLNPGVFSEWLKVSEALLLSRAQPMDSATAACLSVFPSALPTIGEERFVLLGLSGTFRLLAVCSPSEEMEFA
jgi:hypothetical protein